MSAEPKEAAAGRRGGRPAPPVEFEAAYEPDLERALRGLGILLGLPPEEIERVVAESKLASPREM